MALLGVIALNLALEGFFLSPLAWWERLLLLPAALGLLEPGWGTTAAGLAILAGVLGRQVVRLRTARPLRAAADPPRA